MKRIPIYIIMLLGLLAAGCHVEVDPPEPVAPPMLVGTVPEDGTTGLEGENLTITLTFDQNIKCPMSQQSLITIDGNAAIENINAYMNDEFSPNCIKEESLCN